eukprot:7822691-Alexandrium_andersonii.AAC.1
MAGRPARRRRGGCASPPGIAQLHSGGWALPAQRAAAGLRQDVRLLSPSLPSGAELHPSSPSHASR